jgi:hypothetical protein
MTWLLGEFFEYCIEPIHCQCVSLGNALFGSIPNRKGALHPRLLGLYRECRIALFDSNRYFHFDFLRAIATSMTHYIEQGLPVLFS